MFQKAGADRHWPDWLVLKPRHARGPNPRGQGLSASARRRGHARRHPACRLADEVHPSAPPMPSARRGPCDPLHPGRHIRHARGGNRGPSGCRMRSSPTRARSKVRWCAISARMCRRAFTSSLATPSPAPSIRGLRLASPSCSTAAGHILRRCPARTRARSRS